MVVFTTNNLTHTKLEQDQVNILSKNLSNFSLVLKAYWQGN